MRNRQARFIMACGVLLASIFLVLEFKRGSVPGDESDYPDLEIPSDLHNIRILLKKSGPGPWQLRSAKPISLQSAEGDVLTNKIFKVSMSPSGIMINGRNAGALATMTEPSVFALNNRKLRGRLHFDTAGKSARPVLHMEVEAYLTQVLAGEMPLSYPDAALEAQVIACRSYALSRMLIRRSRRWDLTDGETSQMFQSLNKNTAKSEAIVRRSRGVVLEFDGRILPAYFSANCGGRTRSNGEAFGEAPLPPLRGVACRHCAWSKNHSWMARIDMPSFRRHTGLGHGAIRNMAIKSGPGSGYTNRIQCRTSNASKLVAPKTIRRRVGNRKIRSDWVTGIEWNERAVTIGGRGFGHGVGLCQNGACGLARLGRTAAEILSHYFPDARLARLRKSSNP